MRPNREQLKHFVRKSVCYVLGLSVVLGARGALIAHAINGWYPPRSLVRDVAALALLMAAFHVIYFLLNRALSVLETPRTMKALAAAGIIRTSFVALVVFPALLSFIQVHPQRICTTATPAIAGLSFEVVELNSRSGLLRGWYLPGAPDAKFAVVLVHGLNANKQNFLYPAKLLHDLGLPVLTFDLPAHGDSDGSTFTFGIREAESVRAAYEWLHSKCPDQKIAGVGYSAGAAALLRAASRYHIFDRIVLDSPLVSIERTAKRKFLWVFGPFGEIAWRTGRLWTMLWTGTDVGEYDGALEIKHVDPRSVFLIAGDSDPLFPAEEVTLLKAAAGEELRSWSVSGVGHMEALKSPEYSAMLAKFFEIERPV